MKQVGITDIVIGINERDYELGQRFGERHNVVVKVSTTRGTAGCLKDCLSEDCNRGIVLFGDTIYTSPIPYCDAIFNTAPEGTAIIGVKRTADLAHFMAVVPHNGGYITRIKPHTFREGFAYIGTLGFYDSTIGERINHLRPSKRGELEITELIGVYAQENALMITQYTGEFVDCNTLESVDKAVTLLNARKEQ